MAKKKDAKKKTTKKSMKKTTPKPKFAIQEDVFKLLDVIAELRGEIKTISNSAEEKDMADQAARRLNNQSHYKIAETMKGLGESTIKSTTLIAEHLNRVNNNLCDEIFDIRKQLQNSRLVRRVRTKSPNGTETTEETFSSEK